MPHSSALLSWRSWCLSLMAPSPARSRHRSPEPGFTRSRGPLSTTRHKNGIVTTNRSCIIHTRHHTKITNNMDSAKILLAGHLRADKCYSYESYPDASLALHRCPHMSFTKSDQTPKDQAKTSNQHHDLSFYIHKVWWQRRPSADSTTSNKSQASTRSE